jgi:hypothetical protein
MATTPSNWDITPKKCGYIPIYNFNCNPSYRPGIG